VDAGSSKETSCRRSCREGNRPQSLEVASLLKLAATNVLFPSWRSPVVEDRTAANPVEERPWEITIGHPAWEGSLPEAKLSKQQRTGEKGA
jgi:hypothetical protein